MQLGILVTGDVNPALSDHYGQYDDMFVQFFARADASLSCRSYAVLEGDFPDSVTECDAWLVTGSKYGVYEEHPWIPPLRNFLREACQRRQPVIGICFGHQILAEALGGKAEKSAKGWGCGVHEYTMVQMPGWLAPRQAGAVQPDKLALHAMHQDQVTVLPEDATVIASSAFCEYAAIVYGDPEAPHAVSIQPHPEFSTSYARDLVGLRAGNTIDADLAGRQLKTFGRPTDADRLAQSLINFLNDAVPRARRIQGISAEN